MEAINIAANLASSITLKNFRTHNNELIFSINVQCENDKKIYKGKEIHILIDTSASMNDFIKFIKSTLISFLNLFEGNDIDITIITFNETAEVLWTTKDEDKDYNKAINSIKLGCKTNMGSAIELSNSLNNIEKNTWVLVFTDGSSNEGKYRSVESFRELKEYTPEKTEMILLGHGDSFNVEVLNCLGRFVYVKNIEYVKEIIESLYSEIVGTFGVDCKLTINVDDEEIKPSVLDPIRLLSGDKDIGLLYNGRNFIYSFIVNNEEDIEKYLLGEYELIYYSIENEISVSKKFDMIDKRNEHVERIVEETYYISSKSRILEILYKIAYDKSYKAFQKAESKIREKIKTWNNEISIVHREEIIYYLEIMEKMDFTIDRELLTKTIDYSVQNSYIDKITGGDYSVNLIESWKRSIDNSSVDNTDSVPIEIIE